MPGTWWAGLLFKSVEDAAAFIYKHDKTTVAPRGRPGERFRLVVDFRR